jgi:hypothetical protein
MKIAMIGEHFDRSRQDARKVMKIASGEDPEKAAEKEREENCKAKNRKFKRTTERRCTTERRSGFLTSLNRRRRYCHGMVLPHTRGRRPLKNPQILLQPHRLEAPTWTSLSPHLR